MREYEVLDGTTVKCWTRGVAVEASAIEQIRRTAALPFVDHMAVMPDTHWGMGSTIGTVIGTRGAIVPAAVGVDLNCGMLAVRTNMTASDLPDSLRGVYDAIRRAVPCGRTNDGGPGDRGAWNDPPQHVADAFEGIKPILDAVVQLAPGLYRAAQRAIYHAGTLGTGNHFIEVCLDEEDRVWVMLHSGSRGIGNAIGRHFIHLAQEDMKRWFINLPDVDLAYIPEGSDNFKHYLAALDFADSYATLNRRLMMHAVLDAMRCAGLPVGLVQDTVVDCHHNYVTREAHFGKNLLVTRKGAVRAREGDLGIIPGSMGARSYIVLGKGNPDSLTSCSHGAGRAMSRGEARRTFTLADHEAATKGIECDKGDGVLDETPGAYKPIDAVMAAQEGLVSVVHELHQVLNVKGEEDSNGRRARKRAKALVVAEDGRDPRA